MNDALKAQLLLNAAKASLSVWEALRDSRSPEALWTEGESLWEKLGMRASSGRRLRELLNEGSWAEAEQERAEKFGARFVPIESPDYPARLKDLPHPPIGLYVKGTFATSTPSVAIVGTRRCSRYGRMVAEAVGRACARIGHRVISGGAKGIDGAGHEGCLEGEGDTVAVLGTGVDRVYPAEHRRLFHRIAERGALVSEYPMGVGGDPWRFPERNRLIVGLCNRLVVVESPDNGGSMITARLALELGREIWCVPGRIMEEASKGTNALIRDGADVLVDIEEFAGKISGRYGQLLLDFGETESPSKSLPHFPPPQLSEQEKKVLDLLHLKGNRTLDDLMTESGLGIADLQTCLVTLCSLNIVQETASGRFNPVN